MTPSASSGLHGKMPTEAKYDMEGKESALWIATGREALGDDSAFPPTMACNERRSNMKRRRGGLYRRVVAGPEIRQRKAIHDAIFVASVAATKVSREPDVAYGMISRIYRSLRDQRGLFFPSRVDWRIIDLHTYADAGLGKCKFTHRSRKTIYGGDVNAGVGNDRYIGSADNLADVFTKASSAPHYLQFVDQFTVRLRDFDLNSNITSK
eukprot:g32847.t1